MSVGIQRNLLIERKNPPALQMEDENARRNCACEGTG